MQDDKKKINTDPIQTNPKVQIKMIQKEDLKGYNSYVDHCFEFYHLLLQNNQLKQELIETSARRDMHFYEITNYLNEPASTPIPDQSQEFHQCYQVNQLDIPQESTPHVDLNLEPVSSSFHLNQIKKFEQDAGDIHELDTPSCHEPLIEQFVDDDSIFLDELVKDDLVMHTTSLIHVENVCVDDEPMFLEELFKD